MAFEVPGITYSTDEEHRKLMRDCYKHARNSNHPTTHNAAFILKDNKVILKGLNTYPVGVKEKPERIEGENRHVYLNHAETDVIYKAAKEGIALEGLEMAMPWLSCHSCANAIISSGIKKLYVHKQMIEDTRAKWQESFREGVEVMLEAGIEIVAYDGVVGVRILQSGKEREV